MGRLNIVEDDDDKSNAVAVPAASPAASPVKSGHKDPHDLARKKCISDESGYFEGTEDLLPGESGSIEILFEKAVPGNNNFKTRLPVPSPAASPVTSGAATTTRCQ